MPTTINGPVHPSNKNCIDWSDKGLVAFATHAVVTILDPWTVQRVQVLELHKSAISELRWCPSRRFYSDGEESRLASVDIAGEVVVCDVVTAAEISRLRQPGTTVLTMRWFAWKDTSRDFIITLHSSGDLILWNTDSGSQVWTHNYPYAFTAFYDDPFDPARLCFTASNSTLTVVGDVSLNAAPSSSGLALTLVQSEKSVVQTVCFHRAYRNMLFAVADNTLFVIDAEVCVVLSKRQLDSTILTLLPAATRDALFLVHTSGTLSLKLNSFNPSGEPTLAQVCNVDGGRTSGARRPIAACLCPSSQAAIAIIHANGKIGIWQLESQSVSCLPYRSYTIDDIVAFDENLQSTVLDGSVRLRLTAHVPCLPATSTILRIRPVSTEEGDPWTGLQLAALSTQSGTVVVVDLFSSRVLREIHAQNSPIKSMEWDGPYALLTAGYNHALSSTNLVRNDVFVTDIRTGVSKRIRPERDESPLTLMRLSHYYCYMALAFRDDPLEIWDLKSMRLLRKMSKTCPVIVDMAWSSKHHGVRQTDSLSVYRENLVVLDAENRLYHVVVKGLHVRDGKEVNTQWKGGGWQLRCMSWKEDLLALGDADGRVVLWDLARRRSTEARNSKTPCLRMSFSRVAQDYTLVVLHPREVQVWDAERMALQTSVALDQHKSVLDAELCGLTLFAICADNCVRVASQQDINRPLPDHDVPLLLRLPTEHSPRKTSLDTRPVSPTTMFETGRWQKETGRGPVQALAVLSERHLKESGEVMREAALQRFLGRTACASLLALLECAAKGQQLPPNLNIFWPAEQFRMRESALCSFLCGASSSSRVVEEAVVLGGSTKEAVVDALVASSQDLLLSSLKAALLVSEQHSEHSKSLIKLIATNLIASDHISEGVQLLFLVGAGADACKYLQSQRLWTTSLRYAKLGLTGEAYNDVWAKWVTHLQMDEKSLSILAYASRGDWPRVATLLRSLEQDRLAEFILSRAPSATEAPPTSG